LDVFIVKKFSYAGNQSAILLIFGQL